MKSFETLVLVRQPVERLWATVRDRLPDLVPSIDEVETVVVLERDEVAPGRTRIVNEWRSTQHIPAVLAKALHATEIGWIDPSEWDSVTRVCRWSIEPSVLGEHIECRGTTTYASAMGGRGSRITFAGSFDFAPGALGKLAGPLERPVAAFVESMVTTLIPKNARSVFEAAAALVDTEVGS